MNFGSYLALYIKDNSKEIGNFNVKHKAKHLEENMWENLCDLWVGKNFFDMTQARSTQEPINKLDFVEMRNFRSQKDTVKDVKW